MKALILAAGEGRRLRPLTLERPKPMLPLGGRPLLEHLVVLLRYHGVREIAINLHYKAQCVVEHFGQGEKLGVSITYSHEERLLGSAGAARRIAWFLTEPFYVLYGDVLTDVNLTALARQHHELGGVATLALYRVDDPSRCGVVELSDGGRIRSFREKPPTGEAAGNLASAGVYVLDPEGLQYVPETRPYDFGGDLFPDLLARGLPLYGQESQDYFLDIGSVERYRQAEVDLARKMVKVAGSESERAYARV